MAHITILGGGSFGTALANIIASNGHGLIFWMRNQEQAAYINKHHYNPKYLKDIRLHEGIIATDNLSYATKDSDIIIISLPSSKLRSFLQDNKEILKNKIIVSTIKGIEFDSFKLMSVVLKEELTGVTVAVLSGPNLAYEIAKGNFTATVVAAEDEKVAKYIQKLLYTKTFRIYTSTDVYGVELGGALKNIYAVMMGAANAQAVGDNTKSMLITRALAEMTRMAEKMGADPLTFLGLSGVGDLIVTCYSDKSRNYKVGFLLGKGYTLEQAITLIGETAEGINTLKVVKHYIDKNAIYMPLIHALYDFIFKQIPIPTIIAKMTAADPKIDIDMVQLHLKL